MSDLTSRHCQVCEAGGQPLSREEAQAFLGQIENWSIDAHGKAISREFKFKNYYQTMAFVNAVAWIAHGEDHHPTLTVDYNRCVVLYSTHAVNGLSENDFICAAKVNALLSPAA